MDLLKWHFSKETRFLTDANAQYVETKKDEDTQIR